MNSKLTLSIEQQLIEKAKQYARSKGRSLSDIIEHYLMIITSEEEVPDDDITVVVKSLKGSFRTSRKFNYKKELGKKLSEKYLDNE
ncbi:MAG: DUF6364 family protein [Bacteroidota bacterium]